MDAEAGLALYQRKVQEAVQLEQDRLDQLSSYKKQLLETRQLLAELPQKLQHRIAVPFGRRAFFLGNLQNTNEVRVHLGCGYYVHCTAYEATGIIQRRLDKIATTVAAGEKTLEEHKARLKVSSSGSVLPGVATDGEEVLDIREDEEKATTIAKPAPQTMPAAQRKPLPQETVDFIDRVINGALQQEEADSQSAASSAGQQSAVQGVSTSQASARQNESDAEYDSDDEDMEFQPVSLQQREDDDSDDVDDMFAPVTLMQPSSLQESSPRPINHGVPAHTSTTNTSKAPTVQAPNNTETQRTSPTSAAFKKGFLLSQPKKQATPISTASPGTSGKLGHAITARPTGASDQLHKQKEAVEVEKARREAFTEMIVERSNPAASVTKTMAEIQPGKRSPVRQPQAVIPEIVERPMPVVSSKPVRSAAVEDVNTSSPAAPPRVSKFKQRLQAQQLDSLD